MKKETWVQTRTRGTAHKTRAQAEDQRGAGEPQGPDGSRGAAGACGEPPEPDGSQGAVRAAGPGSASWRRRSRARRHLDLALAASRVRDGNSVLYATWSMAVVRAALGHQYRGAAGR